MRKTKDGLFDELVCEAKTCRQCKRMDDSIRVIGAGSGRIDAPVMIVGEAPGRLGADASAIPFHGDKAGENFEILLEQVGLTRHDCFVTNAVLCNPKDEKGNNATPTRVEVENCAKFLKSQIEIVDPKIVVTLGAQSLNALKLIQQHEITLAEGVRKSWNWNGRILIPMYHPGQRAMMHRSFLNQLADYKFLAETFFRMGRSKRSVKSTRTSENSAKIAKAIIEKCQTVSYFSLHKLFYLIEYEHFLHNNERITQSYIVRQKDGPYVTELNIKRLKKAIDQLEIWDTNKKLMLGLSGTSPLFDDSELSREVKASVDRVIDKYGKYREDDLKRVVYLTTPMRKILRVEKKRKTSMFNTPIDFTTLKKAS